MLFEVFDELVFPAQFVVIPKVVDFLVRRQFFLIEFGNELFFAPDDVPLGIVDCGVPSALECLEDAVGEVRFELDGGAT